MQFSLVPRAVRSIILSPKCRQLLDEVLNMMDVPLVSDVPENSVPRLLAVQNDKVAALIDDQAAFLRCTLK